MNLDNHKIEDRILLRKAACRGRGDSLAIIYTKYQPIVHDYLKRAGADGMAEDICQAVFMQIQEGRCKYDGSSEVKSYLFGVARNLFKQELKSENTKTFNRDRIQVDGNLLVQRTIQECPTKALEAAESHQVLRDVIPQLPPKAYQAVKLVFLDGIPAKKAAKIAKCDFKAFRDRLDYGLRCLKKHGKLD